MKLPTETHFWIASQGRFAGDEGVVGECFAVAGLVHPVFHTSWLATLTHILWQIVWRVIDAVKWHAPSRIGHWTKGEAISHFIVPRDWVGHISCQRSSINHGEEEVMPRLSLPWPLVWLNVANTRIGINNIIVKNVGYAAWFKWWFCPSIFLLSDVCLWKSPIKFKVYSICTSAPARIFLI